MTGNAPPLVVYEKSGGFAGVHERIVVDHTGKAVVRNRTITLGSTELRDLRRVLDGITTTASAAEGCDVPDHFTHTLSYGGWRATRCHGVPTDWLPAVSRLAALTEQPS